MKGKFNILFPFSLLRNFLFRKLKWMLTKNEIFSAHYFFYKIESSSISANYCVYAIYTGMCQTCAYFIKRLFFKRDNFFSYNEQYISNLHLTLIYVITDLFVFIITKKTNKKFNLRITNFQNKLLCQLQATAWNFAWKISSVSSNWKKGFDWKMRKELKWNNFVSWKR